MPNVSPLATPHLRTVTAVLPSPVRPVPTAVDGVLRLPEGAVVTPWPQAGLPAELIGGEVPMVGYLVLVPAERSPAEPVASAPQLRSVGSVPAAVGSPAPGIELDLERRTARLDGELLELTYLEFELLAHLTANPHRVHTRDHLVTAVWGYGHVGDGRTVDVHVARLRRKLGARYRAGIVTVRRVGYKYVPPKQG